MKIESKKTSWNAIRARASLLLRLVRCTDDEARRCAAVLVDDGTLISVHSQGASTLCTANVESATEKEDCTTIGGDVSTMAVNVHSVDHLAEAAREISGRILNSLQGARKKTEHAVMAVCDHVTKLVHIARQGNEEARGTLHTIAGTGTSGGLQPNGKS